MRTIKIVTGIGLITILCMSYLHFQSNVTAQTSTDSEMTALQTRIKGFFDKLTAQPSSPDAFPNAYQRLLSGLQSQETGIQDMVPKTEAMMKNGTRWQPEFLDSKSVGSDIILVRYILKSETHPVVWYFTFYRPPTGTIRTWNCIGVRFDTNLDSLFKESWTK